MDRGLSRILLSLTLAFSVAPSAAQSKPLSAPIVPANLQQVARKAALIFTGTVVSVAPVRESGSEAITSVEVTFQVEQALRGLRTGQRYAIREWSGLWVSCPRYRVGQRMMLFLYGPSRVGLTSPVGGSLGRYDVDRSGQVSLPPPRAPEATISAKPIKAGNQHVPIQTFSRAVRQLMEESR